MNSFHFHLPDWAPQRLVREATMSFNLRHLGELKLDLETSPWPLIRGAVLAFLRHQQSNYEDRLCGEHNQELRDELASELARQAFRKYPWLGQDDPRPFPEPPDDSPARLFTEVARNLAHDHGVRDQLLSAIRDLKREGKAVQAEELKRALAEVEGRIKHNYAVLTGPKVTHDSSGGGGCRSFCLPHLPEEMKAYVFLDGRAPTPNRYTYLGFRCPRCQAPVARNKQKVDFGQGHTMIMHSCFCTTVATVCPPPGGRLAPITSEQWAAEVRGNGKDR